MKLKIKTIILLIFGILMHINFLYAQPDPGPAPGDGEPIPLDGGILYLLAAGGIYGIKKIRDHRKKK